MTVEEKIRLLESIVIDFEQAERFIRVAGNNLNAYKGQITGVVGTPYKYLEVHLDNEKSTIRELIKDVRVKEQMKMTAGKVKPNEEKPILDIQDNIETRHIPVKQREYENTNKFPSTSPYDDNGDLK